MAANLFQIVLALALVLMNGLFVAAEIAIVRLRHASPRRRARAPGLADRALRAVRARLDNSLTACRLGIVTASIGLGWIGGPAVARLVSPMLQPFGAVAPGVLQGIGFAVALVILSFLHLVLGELVPRAVSIRDAETILLRTALPLRAFSWLVYPLVWLVNRSAGFLLRATGTRTGNAASSRVGLRDILLAGHGQSPADSSGTSLAAPSLEALTAADVMRSDVAAVNARAGVPEALAVIGRRRSTRFPVYDGEPGRILGFVHVRDLFAAVRRRELDLRPLIRRALVVDTSTPASRVLDELRTGTTDLAVVTDGQGTVQGFVTLDDLVEAAIVRGGNERETRGWAQLNDGNYAGEGSLSLNSLERLLGVEIASGDVGSIGGLIMSRLDRIPRAGDNIQLGPFDVEVLEMHGARVTQVLVRRSGREGAEPGRLM